MSLTNWLTTFTASPVFMIVSAATHLAMEWNACNI